MILDQNKFIRGYTLTLEKKGEIKNNCFICGKEISEKQMNKDGDEGFYLCVDSKRVFHHKCTWEDMKKRKNHITSKCHPPNQKEHEHLLITGVKIAPDTVKKPKEVE